MNHNILLVEDDLKLNELIKNYFASYNYRVFQAENNSEAEEILAKEKIHLIILDIMLPTMNGFDICKKIRQTSNTPILFLSARGEVTDKIVGLEIGADDYMSKPFEPRELLTRVGAILRRAEKNPVQKKTETIGKIKIDWDHKKAYLNHDHIQLTYLEFELLALFFKNKALYLIIFCLKMGPINPSHSNVLCSVLSIKSLSSIFPLFLKNRAKSSNSR